MTGEELLKNMDLMDPKFLSEADSVPAKRKHNFLKWCSVAAAAMAIVSTFACMLGKNSNSTTVMVGHLERHYKNIPISQTETSPFYPPQYLTEIERYNAMTLEDTTYRTRARTVDKRFLGEALGLCMLSSYDIYSDSNVITEAPAYAIAGISPAELVAVKFGEEYCVFLKDRYAPPLDFGAFCDSIALFDSVQWQDYADQSGQTYRLENSETLWQLLEKCRFAPYLEMERFYDSQIETVSFTVTSEPLGIYKHGFQITSDGYICTNLMEWGYVFQIGVELAQNIIRQVKENSVPIPQEPYYNYLYGTFAGIEDGYLLVDDTILCSNKKDGMCFRVPMEDIRISRNVDLGYITVGDVVFVTFSGRIDTTSGNIVIDPVSIQKGILADDSILIEE